MDLRKIKKLMELLEESGLTEIEVKEGEESIKLSRAKKDEAVINSITAEQSQTISETPKKEKISQQEQLKGETIDSPMVGTFYSSPSPDSSPYVDANDNVSPGQTICIVEAMKIMNEIESDVKGKIISILVKDGDPVEYGQKLFQIKPQ